MSLELIYTSAPRGLKPGSRGFCTVACTRGVSQQIIERLETLSGYRNLFAPGDPNAKLNPVSYSHLIIALGGRRYHVLSRIGDAGLDYTQRTNKFAHHVVLDAAELPLAGPAWLLSVPGFLRRRWEGEPEWLPQAPSLPRGESPLAVCRAWQRLTGDAGWGGVLAESVASANRPATIIFPPGLETLPLLVESLALLPAELRWNVTFSTYFTTLPAGVACQWRCLADNTPEATAARREAQTGTLIDLCRPLPPAMGIAYVEAARTGRMPSSPSSFPPPIALPDSSDQELENALKRDERLTAANDAQLSSTDAKFADYSIPSSANEDKPPRFHRHDPNLKPAARWPWILASSMLVILMMAGTAAWLLKYPNRFFTTNLPSSSTASGGTQQAIKELQENSEKIAASYNTAKQDADEILKIIKDATNFADAKNTFAKQASNDCDKCDSNIRHAEESMTNASKYYSKVDNNIENEARTLIAQCKFDLSESQQKVAKVNEARTTLNNLISETQQCADPLKPFVEDAEKTVKEAKNSPSEASIANAQQSVQQLKNTVAITKELSESLEKTLAEFQRNLDSAKTSVDDILQTSNALLKSVNRINETAKTICDTIANAEKPIPLPKCVHQDKLGNPFPDYRDFSQLPPNTVPENISIFGISDIYFSQVDKPAWTQNRLEFKYKKDLLRGQISVTRFAKLIFSDNKFSFQWTSEADGKADLLRNCLLIVKIDKAKEPAFVPLRAPRKPQNVLHINRPRNIDDNFCFNRIEIALEIVTDKTIPDRKKYEDYVLHLAIDKQPSDWHSRQVSEYLCFLEIPHEKLIHKFELMLDKISPSPKQQKDIVYICLFYNGCYSKDPKSPDSIENLQAKLVRFREEKKELEKKQKDTADKSMKDIDELSKNLSKKTDEIKKCEQTIYDTIKESFCKLVDSHPQLHYEVSLLIRDGTDSKPVVLISTEQSE